MYSTLHLVSFLTCVVTVKAAIEMPLGGECRHNARIEGLYDIVFKSQSAGKYKPNTDCVITIEAPRHHGLHLEFTHLDLQDRNESGVCVDSIQIRELQGQNLTVNDLTEKLCGSKVPEAVDTPYSYLQIIFRTDPFVERSGFKFFFTRTDGPTNLDNMVFSAAAPLCQTGFLMFSLIWMSALILT